MRDKLIDVLKSDKSRIMMNYLRKEFDGGHWSPIGAYNAEKDMFLVIDVERCVCALSIRERLKLNPTKEGQARMRMAGIRVNADIIHAIFW